MTNRPNGTLYVGVTNSLERRVWQHKSKLIAGFTKQYGLNNLVHFEEYRSVTDAISREKELEGWLRKKKIVLIETGNPDWRDLSADWFDGNRNR
jgi:putative endonuclease